MDGYRQKLESEDPICTQDQVKEFCYNEWPKRGQLRADLISFWKVKDSLSLYNDLLLYDCIVVPESLQKDVLKRVHEGHQGIDHCRFELQKKQ